LLAVAALVKPPYNDPPAERNAALSFEFDRLFRLGWALQTVAIQARGMRGGDVHATGVDGAPGLDRHAAAAGELRFRQGNV
jgi:hypothetical protein